VDGEHAAHERVSLEHRAGTGGIRSHGQLAACGLRVVARVESRRLRCQLKASRHRRARQALAWFPDEMHIGNPRQRDNVVLITVDRSR